MVSIDRLNNCSSWFFLGGGVFFFLVLSKSHAGVFAVCGYNLMFVDV